MDSQIRIFLADLTYNTVSLATEVFPLNVGLIASYCNEKFGDKIQIIGVDPYGSLLATENEQVYNYDVEGIGYDFFPDVLDNNLIESLPSTFNSLQTLEYLWMELKQPPFLLQHQYELEPFP